MEYKCTYQEVSSDQAATTIPRGAKMEEALQVWMELNQGK
jgi:hypothetical protein